MTTTPRPLAGTVFTETLRGVRCVRLSVLTDETTSPERQREADDIAAAALGIDFGDGETLREAVDLDVSASKVSPFDRPQLGIWLARPNEFDVLVFWRFDRAIRSMADMHELAKWAKKHRKMLVFAEGIGGGRFVFDFRNPMDPTSELMMMMLAFAAQVEAQSIRDRVSSAQAAMRTMQLRWAGGAIPYGYMSVPMPKEHGGIGMTLMPDPDAVKVIERIVAELLSGRNLTQIAIGLNDDKIPSSRDHQRLRKGKETGGIVGSGVKGRPGHKRERHLWQACHIKRILTSFTMLGWKVHDGNPVRDHDGNPVMITTGPIMTRAEFDQIGALLAEASRPTAPRVRRDTIALLLRVIHCDGCQGRMYLRPQGSGTHRYYQCTATTRGERCAAPSSIRADWADAYVEGEFLRVAGTISVNTVVENPGYDPEPELQATLAEFAEHQEQKGRQKSKHAAAEWQKRADALDSRIADLESREKTPATRTVTPTGRTYADEWHAADHAGRRAMLMDAGARLDVRRGVKGGWRKLDVRRVDFTMTGELDPAAEAVTVTSRDVAAETRGDMPPAPGSVVRLAEPAPELVQAA
ncbi:recombinase family protein [Streptomyces sp. NPDC087212]|uniref:recombinase family protein n=1 Tax=Streptomyces sp. NPDC087212 TaxID=3365766 RepID=UPI00380F7B05